MSLLPKWAEDIVAGYESKVSGCFVLHGNVGDRMLVPMADGLGLGSLGEFLGEVLLPKFEVVLGYDLGEGLRVERGEALFQEWAKGKDIPGQPLGVMRYIGEYLRYVRNLRAVSNKAPRVAVVVRESQLVCPAFPNGLNYELNALASLWCGWAASGRLQENRQAVFLVADRWANLHPLLTREGSVRGVELPLPDEYEVTRVLEVLSRDCPVALEKFVGRLEVLGRGLRGTTLGAVEGLVRGRQFARKPLVDDDVGRLKRELVERDCEGLIEFIEPERDLDQVIGLEEAKEWLREDLALWKKGELEAMPMGYLFCGPVGTGKTYLAECLAGEAGVPVVVMRNFRDKWVGSTEANLEKIFALLHALGRCLVFVDEADQALGQRQSGSGDSGVNSRVYSMMAAEMSDTDNRGKIVWVLASSRPDLIEIDLKRPGRMDVKIPLFPSTTPAEGFALVRALCGARGVKIAKDSFERLKDRVPDLLTPGAAEAIAVKVFRRVKSRGEEPEIALKAAFDGYLPPVPHDILRHQMKIAAKESTEPHFVSERVKSLLGL